MILSNQLLFSLICTENRIQALVLIQYSTKLSEFSEPLALISYLSDMSGRMAMGMVMVMGVGLGAEGV